VTCLRGYFEKDDAIVKNGQLFFKSKLGADVWYMIQADGSLDAEFHPKGTGKIKMVDRPRRL
jgi:hypothetical protein